MSMTASSQRRWQQAAGVDRGKQPVSIEANSRLPIESKQPTPMAAAASTLNHPLFLFSFPYTPTKQPPRFFRFLKPQSLAIDPAEFSPHPDIASASAPSYDL